MKLGGAEVVSELLSGGKKGVGMAGNPQEWERRKAAK